MRFSPLVFFLSSPLFAWSQTTDSTYAPQQFDSAGIRATTSYLPSKSSGSISRSELDKQAPYALISSMNAVTGVRMEERSPGSYRLSIRGSLLRSPFGVRNIKIYLDELPLTDAGGNTYLNSLDMSHLGNIRIYKGPSSSEFGANTGGAVVIDPLRPVSDSSKLRFGISAGSYGLAAQNAWFRKRFRNSALTLQQAYQRSDGYRRNSAMKRQYWQAAYHWDYTSRASLRILALYSDLFYQTPGALTLQQYNADPRAARPSTPVLPGAAEQKASISNSTILAGLTHTYSIHRRVKHVLALTGSATDFKNPFITNYEVRKEYSAGMRTYISLYNQRIAFNLGAEAQQTISHIDNYGNRLGVRDTMQASDILKARQAFLFSHIKYVVGKLLLEASLSYNLFSYAYKNNFPVASVFRQNNFEPQLMPRFGVSYSQNRWYSLRASVSTGYSTPTIAEVRASNNLINTNLQAEKALNLEAGIQVFNKSRRLSMDLCVFRYELKSAIVRRTDSAGNEYFINAGGTIQNGLEAQFKTELVKPKTSGLIRTLSISANLTWYHFSFAQYQVNGDDYSGHPLTGVPAYTSTESVYMTLPKDFSLFAQYYYAGPISLNDANTERTAAYHLVQLKAQWKHLFRTMEITLFAGIDNLLNERYSLGNDLNALGGRYYNAAAPRNYYGGINIRL